MSTRAVAGAVVIALLLVLAGCGAPAANTSTGDRLDTTTANRNDGPSTWSSGPSQPTPTESGSPRRTSDVTGSEPTPTSDATAGPPEVAVENGTLPVDPGEVFARVQDLTGTDVQPLQSVTVVDDPSAVFGDASDRPGAGTSARREFFRLVGVTNRYGGNESAFERMENGATTGFGRVRIYPGPAPTAANVEPILAHEFAHYLEVSDRRVDRLVGGIRNATTTDGGFAFRSMREGAAVWIETAYVREYVRNGTTGIDRTERVYGRYPPGSVGRYGMAQYVFGYRYVRSRVEDPSDLEAIYERPPQTSEQVLHGHPPGTERPAPLSVEVDGEGTPYAGVTADRLGEAFVRVALENGVSTDRAVEAATGWGNDRLAIVRREGDVHFVWVLRWDDPANATTFASAMREFLDARGSTVGNAWTVNGTRTDLRRPHPNTTVLVAGDEAFVRGVTVTLEGPAVTIVPPDDGTADRAGRLAAEPGFAAVPKRLCRRPDPVGP